MSGTMEKLIEALEANTAMHAKVLAGFAKAAGGTSGTTSSKPAEAAKEKPAPADKPKDKPKGKKATSLDDIVAAFGGYLGIKDADERTVRKANVKEIVDYFGVAKASDIDVDKFDEALGYLQSYIDGEEPSFKAGDDDDGDDDEALV